MPLIYSPCRRNKVPFRFGWFSTGRDLAARQLLQAARERMGEGLIPGEITFVFCDRERGEAEGSDLFLDLVEELGVQAIAPCHCSGDLARELFKEAYGDNYYAAGVGWQLTLANPETEGPESK